MICCLLLLLILDLLDGLFGIFVLLGYFTCAALLIWCAYGCV